MVPVADSAAFYEEEPSLQSRQCFDAKYNNSKETLKAENSSSQNLLDLIRLGYGFGGEDRPKSKEKRHDHMNSLLKQAKDNQ